MPLTCSELAYECGQHNDGCGELLNCGSCSESKICNVGICVLEHSEDSNLQDSEYRGYCKKGSYWVEDEGGCMDPETGLIWSKPSLRPMRWSEVVWGKTDENLCETGKYLEDFDYTCNPETQDTNDQFGQDPIVTKEHISDERYWGVFADELPTKNYCHDLRQGGYDDWRVPTIEELEESIINSPSSGHYDPDGNFVLNSIMDYVRSARKSSLIDNVEGIAGKGFWSATSTLGQYGNSFVSPMSAFVLATSVNPYLKTVAFPENLVSTPYMGWMFVGRASLNLKYSSNKANYDNLPVHGICVRDAVKQPVKVECGDGVCLDDEFPGEKYECLEDCKPSACGNDICEFGEDFYCVEDCACKIGGDWEEKSGGCKDTKTGLIWYRLVGDNPQIGGGLDLTWMQLVHETGAYGPVKTKELHQRSTTGARVIQESESFSETPLNPSNDYDLWMWDGECDNSFNCQPLDYNSKKIVESTNFVRDNENEKDYCYKLTVGGVPPGTWRVPTIEELHQAICQEGHFPNGDYVSDYSHCSEFLRENGLKDNVPGLNFFLYSSTTYSGNSEKAIIVHPYSGETTSFSKDTYLYYQRYPVSTLKGLCIRDDSLPEASVCGNNKCELGESSICAEDCFCKIGGAWLQEEGGCKDPKTGLIWSSVNRNPVTFFEAENYCNSLNQGGFDDWRLPTNEEFNSASFRENKENYYDATRQQGLWDNICGGEYCEDINKNYDAFWSSSDFTYSEGRGYIHIERLYYNSGFDSAFKNERERNIGGSGVISAAINAVCVRN